MTPLQPGYANHTADRDSLTAVIFAQAMNHGNLAMAQTSDTPYQVLKTTNQQYLRPASPQAANDRISNAIAELPIFPHYSFDLCALYGSEAVHLYATEPDAPGDNRAGRADPQHLHFAILTRPQLQRNIHRSQNRIESYHQLRSTIAQVGGQKGTYRQDRYRDGDQQPMREAGCKRHHVLQFSHFVPAGRQIRRKPENPDADQEDFAGSQAAPSHERPLHLRRQRWGY